MGKTSIPVAFVLLAITVSNSPSNAAPANVAGTYANLSFNVDGAGGQNRSMPRLDLDADKTYTWGKESGTYEYREGRIYLSGSHAAWGPGRVDSDFKIWFEFTKQGKHYTVTMYRVSGK